jgi:zinc transporter 1/2/3
MLLKSVLAASILALVSADTLTVTSTRDYRVGPTASQTDGLAVTKNRVGSSELNSGDSQTTAITSCHLHGSAQFCVDGSGNEGSIVPAPTNTQDAPSSYTGCHSHEDATFCLDSSGNEVQFMIEEVSSHGSNSSSSTTTSGSGGNNLKAVCMLSLCALLPYLI